MNIDYFAIINENLNYSIIPYILSIISFFFEAKIFFFIFAVCTIIRIIRPNSLNQDLKSKINMYLIQNRELCQIITCYLLLIITFYLIKHIAQVPRPFCSLEKFYTIFSHLDWNNCYNSFPSAHMGLAFLSLIQFWKYIKTTIRKILCVIIVFALGLSRISLAMHFPLDIILTPPIVVVIIWVNKFIFRQCLRIIHR